MIFTHITQTHINRMFVFLSFTSIYQFSLICFKFAFDSVLVSPHQSFTYVLPMYGKLGGSDVPYLRNYIGGFVGAAVVGLGVVLL